MKQLEVQIMQQSYLLGCPDGHEARLLDAVERVDTAMTRIRDAGKVRARERIAVLAALNLAFELADREATELAAAAQPPADPHTGMPATEGGNALPHEDERLQALVRRLDEALGNDGRLL
ncbi:MAG: cell division protein ZapA [Giesbergeria sp.]|jgi:cell division protein ZapA|nr:cell division protein ZapA [Giesbergeria sp.]